jgi:hypothetical protein
LTGVPLTASSRPMNANIPATMPKNRKAALAIVTFGLVPF